jgi:hypothetical protein
MPEKLFDTSYYKGSNVTIIAPAIKHLKCRHSRAGGNPDEKRWIPGQARNDMTEVLLYI